ncbi:PilW family protein [Roseateles sp. BYS78W]|uniref:PilW family protein n=1 Tax=Pelomonas candidula TaxID=3299025 RepID=A0ABW7HGB0_9BURK
MQDPRRRANLQAGFTLIELMVGMVVGLLAVLVITQVLALAEGKKRTVSMGSDAQINGALALFTLQRDIAQAGYGAAAIPEALGCTAKYQAGTSGTFTLAPVIINQNGQANGSDTLTILQANTTNFSAPMALTEDTANPPTSATPFKVTSSLGAAAGNLMVLVPLTRVPNSAQGVLTPAWTMDGTVPCSVFSVTDDAAVTTTALTATQVPHVNGAGMRAWNQDSVFPAIKVEGNPSVLKSVLLNMGSMVLRTYSVSAAGNLQGTDLSLTDGSMLPAADLYPQIVKMQAFYGKDTDGDGKVDAYNKTAPTSNAEWKQVKTLRIAIVARSGQFEKEEVTATAPQWDLGSTIAVTGTATCNGSSACLSLDVSALADWKHYRYKVYDTIVPLRNVLWHS